MLHNLYKNQIIMGDWSNGWVKYMIKILVNNVLLKNLVNCFVKLHSNF